MPSRQRPFQQIDVFTAVPYAGNPLAVVLDGDGLDEATMLRFANWTNLSETTFLLPPTDPGADYRVRIFTPQRELPFAGHPTLGSCHAWLRAGGQPRAADRVVQQCGVGLVSIRRGAGAQLAFAAPPLIRSGPLEPSLVDHLCAGLGLTTDDIVAHQWTDNGPGWTALLLHSDAAVRAVTPDAARLGADQRIGLVGPCPAGSAASFEVRALISDGGSCREDPVTGSLNAGIAQWLIDSGRAPLRYDAIQGTVLGRDGRIRVERDADGATWVGGDSVCCIDGTVLI